MKNIQLTLMPDVRCKGFQKEEKRVGWEGLFNLFGIFGAVGEPAPTNCREFCHISVTSVTSRTLFVAELSPA
jgi:hypothetical protein